MSDEASDTEDGELKDSNPHALLADLPEDFGASATSLQYSLLIPSLAVSAAPCEVLQLA